MIVLWHCEGCREPRLLLARVILARVPGDLLLCYRCWVIAGRPWPKTPGTVEEVHAATLAIRERMFARGGATRHMVRSGRT